MKAEYIEKIYAGWLAKIIGIRLGAPIEGWTYQAIQNMYGELHAYPSDFINFAADDDSNGPLFFLRALEDIENPMDLTAQDVACALLNYAPFEHGFFWWGGYGVSTEHTAYLNLRNGIPAPRSGSIQQNGSTMAEQIGGQIFIDSWGLVTPGNPDLAAQFAAKAASVTHDGNGIYGGVFIAACISQAFVESNVRNIIEKGLSYIPADCEYTRVVRAVMDFYESHPTHWRDCFDYIYQNFGYDKYPGNCHIIPNTAVMILSLLYGKGDFSDTLNICNMCGWDTDCNVGNVATIMGIICGLEGIDYEKWRKPINDLLICSGVMGSLNIMDISYGAAYITKLAYRLAESPPPEPYREICENRIHSCHFEFPGSTHAIRVRWDGRGGSNQKLESFLENTQESAATGTRSLKVSAKPLDAGEFFYIYQKTYYTPEDFNDSRYDPSFSPTVYPGQTLHGSIMLPSYAQADVKAQLYVKDQKSGEIYCGEKVLLPKGQWTHLTFEIPSLKGALLEEMGFKLSVLGADGQVGSRNVAVACLIDDLYAQGSPHYVLDFAKATEEVWNVFHREVSQITKLKGHMYLAQDMLHLSCSDFGEAYTGGYDWKDYFAQFKITPVTGQYHQVNFRVQGAIRSYAVGLLPEGKIALLKNDNGYKVLAETDFVWSPEKEYAVSVQVKGNSIQAQVDQVKLSYQDTDRPYLYGSVGVSVRKGSHIACRSIEIQP